MKKNDILTAKVETTGYNGEGILHIDGTTVFVPFVLPEEEIEFKVLKVKGSIAFGKVERILTPSENRVEPTCPIFKKCGGCQLQHLRYEKQIELKAQTVKECFKKIAGLDIGIDKNFLSPNAFGYRNKMQLPIRSVKGEVKVGFFREGSHDVIEANDCPIQPDWAKDVIGCVKRFIEKSGISCYDETAHSGTLRHVIVREINGEFIFTLVYNGDTKKYDNELIAALSSKFDKISVYINENRMQNNVILGAIWRKVCGKGVVDLEEFGVSYSIGAQSFFQVNTPVKHEIYGDVFERAGIDENTVVVDAFSGAGVLTAMLAKRAKKAYGVEIIKEAVEAADELKKRNAINNMQNICSPCEDVLPELIERASKEAERVVLVLDPPRGGVDRGSLEAVLDARPQEIIYISCSPQTLARDVGILTGALKYENNQLINLSADFSPNYDIKSVGVYDMFPQTKHVETLICLFKK